MSTAPASPVCTRHERRGHDLAIEYLSGMLAQQRRLVNETPRSHPSCADYRARLTVLIWAYDGLVQQSADLYGTDPSSYELAL